jgi:hypothetical protein
MTVTGPEWMVQSAFKALCSAMNIDPQEFVKSARAIEARVHGFGDALSTIDYRLNRIEQRLGIPAEVHFLVPPGAVPPPEAAMPAPKIAHPKEIPYAHDQRDFAEKP